MSLAHRQKLFSVPVRNERTGEESVVSITATHYADAQVAACGRMFHEHGWHKTTAMIPREIHVRLQA